MNKEIKNPKMNPKIKNPEKYQLLLASGHWEPAYGAQPPELEELQLNHRKNGGIYDGVYYDAEKDEVVAV